MADNLNVQIGIDTSKVNADIAVLKAKLTEATKEMNRLGKEAAKTGDETKLKVASQNVDGLTRSLVANQRVLRAQRAELAGVGAAATGAARGLHETAVASLELAEAHRGTLREVFTLSKDLGKLEISGIGVAKAFREIPKVAGPLAIAAGTTEALLKFANAGYKNVTALDDLSKASGFTGKQIVAFEKIAERADVTVEELNKTIRSVGESFDKAKVKAGDFGSMISGVQVGRGPGRGIDDQHGPGGGAGYGPGGRTQSITPGLSDYQAPLPRGVRPTSQAAGTPSMEATGSGFQGGVFVQRGGERLNIDPSKGFAGLLDPNQFKDANAWAAELRKLLLKINELAPILGWEVIRGQGLDPSATLRLAQQGPKAWAEAMGEAGADPRLRPGALGQARRFGASKEALGAEAGKTATEAGLLDMPSMQKGVEFLKNQLSSITETLQAFSVSWGEGLKHITTTFATETAAVGADLANSFSSAMNGGFQAVASGYDKLRNYMLSNPLPVPSTGSQEGQVIPLAKAAGGLIPGLGRGDTVSAMLEPGEYVNRRASVDYYGSGVFSALNNRMLPRDLFSRMGFAVGGLVGDGMHFADGGMVPSGGGTPVHLHLDGQQFVMSASDHVASALVTASQRYQMRSAGVKPSWYGGRPGA